MAADLEIGVSINARGTKAGGAEARREIRSVGDEAERTSRRTRQSTSAAAQDYQKFANQVKPAAQQSAAAIKQVDTAVVGSAASMSRLSAAAGPVGIAIAAVTVVALLAVVAYVKLLQIATQVAAAYAKYAIEVANAAEANGLAVQTQAALTHEMEAQGRASIGLEGAMSNLRKMIGEASAGSVDARKNLKLLGIDATTAAHDIDGAFRQAVKSILNAPNEIEQMRRGFAAFGDDFQKLRPFLKDMGGDVDAVIERARQLGIVIGDDNVESAGEFNRAYANVAEQLQQIIHLFGNEFLPVIERVLSRFSFWLNDNRSGMQNLAEVSAWGIGKTIGWLEALKSWIDDHPNVFTAIEMATLGAPATAARVLGGNLGEAIRNKANELPLGGSMGGNALGMDSGVYNAARNYKAPKSKTPKLTEEQKQYQAMQKLIADLGREIEFYGDKSKVAAVKQQILSMGVKDLNSAIAQQAIALAGNIDALDAQAEAAKKADEAQKKYKETYDGFIDTIREGGFDKNLALRTDIVLLKEENRLGRELNEVEKNSITMWAELGRLREAARKAGVTSDDIDLLQREWLEQQNITHELLMQLDAELRIKALREEGDRLTAATANLNADLAAELAELNEVYRTGAEVTTEFRVQQELLKDTYKGLTEAQREEILTAARRNDAMREALKAQAEAQRQYDEFRNTILDGLDALEGGWGNFFKWMANRFKQMLKEMVADWLTSKFFQLFFKGGNQQIAGQNRSGGGIFGSILQGIFGRGANGQGPGGTPVFNPNAGATGSINAAGEYVVNGSQSGGGLGGFGGLSGLFGKGGLTQLAGMLPFVGGGLGKKFGGPLGLLGGALLGATGFAALGGFGALASAGAISGSTGLAATALLINPFTIAAGVGLLVGGILLSRNRRRRKEEQQRNAAMLSSFDALKQFDTLIADVRGLRLDGASGIAQGEALGQQVRTQYLEFANSLKDKKTRRIALADVSRIDAIITRKMAELRAAADVANAAGERARRLIPEFAGGAYISPEFRRYNGMIGGQWSGRDMLPAMLAHREMVLNPMQQAKVIAQAGFDVFKHAAIPGYAGGTFVNQASPVTVNSGNMAVTVVVQQDEFGRWKAHAQSDAGQRITAKIVENKYSNDELRFKRRG